MVSRTQTRPSHRSDVSSDAQEFDVDLDDYDSTPDETTVVIDQEDEQVLVDDGSNEYWYDVVDDSGRVRARAPDYPRWVDGVLRNAVGVDVAQ